MSPVCGLGLQSGGVARQGRGHPSHMNIAGALERFSMAWASNQAPGDALVRDRSLIPTYVGTALIVL
jgi:hypothetical protein